MGDPQHRGDDTPELLPPIAEPQPSNSKSGWFLLAVMLIAIAAGGSAYFGGLATGSTGDRISEGERAVLQASFDRAQGDLVPVDLSSDEERSAIHTKLALPKEEAERVLELADDGRLAIGWISVWDNFDEDGDVVTIASAGFVQTIPITHLPTVVALPYLPGQSVSITGTRDGGGGVTVAVELSTGPIPLPPLQVGQTVDLPVL